MNDIERRLCWYEVRDALYMPDLADWPEALPVPSVAWLRRHPDDKSEQSKKKYRAFYSLLQNEINAGRLLERGEPLEIKKTTVKREFQGFSQTRGGIEVWADVEHIEKVRLSTVRAADLANLLQGADLGRYLSVWLMPYHQAVEVLDEDPEGESGLTRMKRAAILNQLGRKYPSLESAFKRTEPWIKSCSTGKHGEYFLERIEEECLTRWGGGELPTLLAGSIRTHKIRG